MRKKKLATELLLHQKLLPLYYHDNPVTSVSILRALYNAGIRIVEYTNRGDHALKNFRAMKKIAKKELAGLMIGVGTIKNKKEARQFIAAGADFIVCPTMNALVGKEVKVAGLLWIPGCMTPSEIAQAEIAGATIVKLFPGNLLGPSYVRSVQKVFPALQFIPTGGVEYEKENIRNWFDSGVVAIGMGSKLITKELVQLQDYESISRQVIQTLQWIGEIKG